jgi:adenylosuccinate synthase
MRLPCGIWETTTRCEILARIREIWLAIRLAKLGVELTPDREKAASDPALMRQYLDEVRFFRQAVVPAPIDAVVARKSIVFEGAQGLLLDQNHGSKFPFVTRSNTGLANVIALASDAGIGHLDVVYMTRAYLTRHGAGPLPNEVAELSFADVVDATNRPNPWQGSLRVAPLDLDVLCDTIVRDISDAQHAGVAVEAGVGVTCVDQLRSRALIRSSGRDLEVPSGQLAATIADAVGLPLVIEAHGPVRGAVRMLGGSPDGALGAFYARLRGLWRNPGEPCDAATSLPALGASGVIGCGGGHAIARPQGRSRPSSTGYGRA